MPAYLIANVTVTDPERYAAYRAQAPAVIARYGGRYLVRAGQVHQLEGDMALDRVVVLEFPTLEAAQAFYASADYAPLRQIRQQAARSSIVLVEGAAP